jgi:hypothetical protein
MAVAELKLPARDLARRWAAPKGLSNIPAPGTFAGRRPIDRPIAGVSV